MSTQFMNSLNSFFFQMKDSSLLPYILPNVFAIAAALSPNQFATLVLPSLKPLFSMKEPPQNMITLLNNLELLQQKTDKAIFHERAYPIHNGSSFYHFRRSDVLPLVYNALESEHSIVSGRMIS